MFQSKMTKGNISKEMEGRVVNFDHLIFWVANAKIVSIYTKDFYKQSEISTDFSRISSHYWDH